ncbi:MAG: choice-of-anchor Q domain-containing protein [Planctomycetota bacterium]|jgi:predicted outer membrane repeat protein
MLKKSSYNWSMSELVFTALLGLILLSSIAVADINDKVAQLDFDTATLDDIIDIFGEPVAYLWGDQTYTKDNLPNVYIARYPNEFGILMVNGHIDELRFESSAAGYLFQGQIQVGSSLDDVLAVVGQPTETLVNQSWGNEDGVLYKDINGTVGYCYYRRSDQNVRFFFLNYAVSALYLTHSTTSPPPPTSSVEPFDDVRSVDLAGLDLSDQPGLIETLTFNEETIWPELAKMPKDREPDELITTATNPGLGVRSLHQQGITGTGINVAIIDQPIYLDHPEYNGKITAYYDTGCDGPGSSMHGPAVTSLLVGENCGTAPGANVYYAAAPSWKRDAAYYADALNWIIAQNETLPASEKIRVVSVSAAPSGPGSPFLYNNQMWDDAVVLAEAAGILILDCTNHHGFINRAWYDLDDPENVTKCTAGTPGYPPGNDTEGIHVPASCRTTAQHYDYHGRDSYIYWGRGGLSWSIPYCAGVLAMGWQTQPQLSADQMVDLLFETAYVNPAGAKIINPSAFVALLEANAPTIELSAEEFVFSAVSDGPLPDPQIISIFNSGLGALNWVIDETCDWLDVNPANGTSTGPADIDDVTLTVTDISPGVYNCQLTISDPCAINTPQIVSITLYVSNVNAQTIQDAIDAAEEGDTVIIDPGVYMGDGNRDLDFKGKEITLRSIEPDDPDVVASTIIICQGTESEPHRGFYFHNNEDANSVLSGFTITGGYETFGGAIYCNNSSPTIRNCVIVDNYADNGGGIRNYNSSATVTNCTFSSNYAASWGGGMTNRNSTSPIIVTNCVFTDNQASWGGGIRNYSSSTTVINCTFINNLARGWEGGGLSDRDGAFSTVINCTFSGNSSAFRGGGIYSDEDSRSTITNSILWKNSDAGGTDESAQVDNDGPIPIISYSCVQGWTGGLGGVGNIGDDPCFVDAGIDDYHLIAVSACVDAGDNTAVAVDIDLDGNPRIVNGIVDMGAYESYPAEPADLVDDLAGDIIELYLPEGIENNLLAKLNAAIGLLGDGNENNDVAAVNLLEAFINAVQAQSGKMISQADADALISAAEQIINILSSE